MKNDLKIPTPVMALQVILSALAGASTKLYLQNFGWLIQLIAFIIIFVVVYLIVGIIYLRLKK
ncbi:hypothetical protein [Lactococcus lactis]|uniref:hypothetical protein n=1 Tax=Lactococcus lactis TaxID=1358 RepID=UPI0003B9FBFD|nr:hypothetical protein [Lactococcus lactis]AGY44374.1 hypothetical protein P620_07880 [Lactococcus lactis subsp. lactis KLDS 4.0325]KHE77889.1 hypothetical protein N489_01995 [Lactococcus lactis subsp. lactis 1AA59]KSU15879.1 hypothetical protein LMG14418_2334 [Lactococcus lactis subsp. lactis]MBG1278645.1 hypothetical protein [Lactococcus lactis subsp. lactis]MCX7529893.1 hypothetical protein [Lactococcus lactis]